MAFNFTIPGLGSTVSYATTSGGSYTAVTQLKSIEGTNGAVTMVDSSGLGSSSGEQVPSLFRGGDFGFAVWFDPANTTHTALHGYMISKTPLYWKLTFPAAIGPGAASAPSPAKTLAFCGYVSGFSTSGYEAESEVEASIKVAITGDVTLS